MWGSQLVSRPPTSASGISRRLSLSLSLQDKFSIPGFFLSFQYKKSADVNIARRADVSSPKIWLDAQVVGSKIAAHQADYLLVVAPAPFAQPRLNVHD